MTNFKEPGDIIVAIYENGMVIETSHQKQTFTTIDEWIAFDGHDDVADIVRVLRVPGEWAMKIHDRPKVQDITDTFVDWLLEYIRDAGGYIDWEERYGCPTCVPAKLWYELVEEEAAERDDHDHMMRDPMTYHFGRNWHGVKTTRSY